MSDDKVPMLFREASQHAGISGEEPWEKISERRREQWRRFAGGLRRSGYVIVPASAVPTEEQRAAVKRVLDHIDARVALAFTQEGSDEWFSAYDVVADTAPTPEDIEAARAVAEGGTNER